MKTYGEKSAKKSDLTGSPGWMKPPPIMAKQHLTSFPGGNPFIQPKLRIGEPDDQYEQEADRVADQVMTMPEPKQASVNGQWSLGGGGGKGSIIQRQTAECPECSDNEEGIQRQADSKEEEEPEKEEDESLHAKFTSNKSPPVTPGLQGQIQSMRGRGQPLSASTLAFFEPRFGHDFGSVRVHTGTEAAETAKAINAKAFTYGRDMVFGAGQYSTNTTGGKRLLAHELTHVMQQSASTGHIIRREGGKKRSKSITHLLPPMIKQINVHIGTPQYVTLDWDWPAPQKLSHRLANRSQWGGGFLSALSPRGFFTCSTGAGKCYKNCDDEGISRKNDSMCTPKGGCWEVKPEWTHLRSPSKLRYFVGFQRSSIALHSNLHRGKELTVDGSPHSHGCVRLGDYIAKMIYENIWPGTTKVCVFGKWTGQTCWKGKKEVSRSPAKKKEPKGILV